MREFRAAIIGCGNIGGYYDERESDGNIYTHAGMYRAVEGFTLVCASDIQVERLAEFGRFWAPVKCYQEYQEMLSNEPLDILSIATPDETHHKLLLEAIRNSSPKLIFTEKPLAMDLKSAVEVYEACREKGVQLVVDYIRRWDENHWGVREMIRNGELGPIQSVVGYYVRGLRHNGCQMVNTIQFLIGKIVSVQVLGADSQGSFAGDPSMDLALTLENGAAVQMISLDKHGYGFSIFEIDICGMNGRVRILDGGQRFECFKTEADIQFTNFRKLAETNLGLEKSTYGSAMKRGGEQLVSLLAGESKNMENKALDAIDDLCVIEAALESARQNNRVIPVQRYSSRGD
jgi:predicted dehydrogenase